MRTIHVLQAGRHYFINRSYWGDDAEGVLMYLRAKGVSPDEIAQEGVAPAGALSSSKRERRGPPREDVEKGGLPPLLGYVLLHVV